MAIARLMGMVAALVLPLAGWATGSDDVERVAEMKLLAGRLKYQTGQIRLRDGLATISLTDSFRYLDPAGTDTLLTGIWGNPPARGKTLGAITPTDFSPFDDGSWCVVLSYDEDGHVNDDDAAKIDYADLLKTMQQSAREESQQRVKDGYPAIALVGWATKPSYERTTHKFYWAKEIKFGDGQRGNTLNYNLRILGRGGVLVLNVVAGMAELHKVEAAVPDLLRMVDFNPGQRYADFTPGTDKLATYGLAALVAGGVAAKSGLLKGAFVALLAMKKFVLMGIVALIAFLRRVLGGRSSEGSIDQGQ